ncbi:MAG: aromatic ring-hydroxylating dioxygenase subunit alpha [Dehalococcoidia bacterium]|nr:aromatic ring-hydroxylating dioxygenase subunit alpha [Dehalococcoidia bacterium]
MNVSTKFGSLVDRDKWILDRKMFVDEDIYQQELEQIFGRCWLFLGHESQVAKNNDFIGTRMGEDPVLLTRDAKGKVHGFLNMCRHRGNRVCRADLGNAPSFMCTYHGWTFATDGKLVGVPGYKEAYFEELDRSQWGLVETAQIASYKGLVFATWDPAAPSLTDYLGDMAWYLDMGLDNRAGGIEFLPGVQKNVLPCNWKYPCDNNGGDSYHSPITHYGSASVLDSAKRKSGASAQDGVATVFSAGYEFGTSRPVSAGNGHCVTSFGGWSDTVSTRRPTGESANSPSSKYRAEHLPERIERLGELRGRSRGTFFVFTMFPNFSGSNTNYRMLHPKGSSQIEEWIWVPVDKDAPKEVKEEARKAQTLSRGPSGVREEEDQNNFMDCTRTAKSLIGRQYMQNLQLGLGHEVRDERVPGYATRGPNEVNQRSFYKRWAEMMDAPSWSQVHIDPITYNQFDR